MLKLIMWYNYYLKNGRKDWVDYSFTVDEVEGALSEKYKKGTRETFASVVDVAQRIVQLQREDNNYPPEFLTGFSIDKEQNKIIDDSAYVQSKGSSQVSRQLSDAEIGQLTDEIFAILKGK